MFRKMPLQFHLFFQYGLLSLLTLFLGIFALFMISDFERVILQVNRGKIPLSRSLGEIARHQLDQSMRFNEILIHAETGNREKFEIVNENFTQAGKRLEDELLEGRNLAQKGIEEADSEETLKTLDTIKTILKNIEKTHGDFQHLAAALIRNIYQFEFLTKEAQLTSGDHLSIEENQIRHLKFLKSELSAMEDETRRLEGLLKNAEEEIKKLSQTLAIDATRWKKQAFKIIIPLLTLFSLGGLLLTLAIIKIHQDRDQMNKKDASQVADRLIRVVSQLETQFNHQGTTGERVRTLAAEQDRHIESAIRDISEISRISLENNEASIKIETLMEERDRNLVQTRQLIVQLDANTGGFLKAEEETQRFVQTLKENLMQINILATNASAEAARSEATRSFIIFTDEIKDMAKKTVTISKTVSNQMADALETARADREQSQTTRKNFDALEIITHKVSTVVNYLSKTVLLQSSLVKALRETAVLLDNTRQENRAVLETLVGSCQTAGAQVKNLESILKGCSMIAGQGEESKAASQSK